ncbi:hypothetical protein C8F04DRAFT_1174719 [Mycena alexandri]|uniref:Uncharacterized protein n=1 Tax=Mycena alexandri TaxID=1745969 RepID=A0AAD6TDN6_9AGAR|nr:hypothetical protein C8F04DRAFT_1174719 [Mycena alexandri]
MVEAIINTQSEAKRVLCYQTLYRVFSHETAPNYTNYDGAQHIVQTVTTVHAPSFSAEPKFMSAQRLLLQIKWYVPSIPPSVSPSSPAARTPGFNCDLILGCAHPEPASQFRPFIEAREFRHSLRRATRSASGLTEMPGKHAAKSLGDIPTNIAQILSVPTGLDSPNGRVNLLRNQRRGGIENLLPVHRTQRVLDQSSVLSCSLPVRAQGNLRALSQPFKRILTPQNFLPGTGSIEILLLFDHQCFVDISCFPLTTRRMPKKKDDEEKIKRACEDILRRVQNGQKKDIKTPPGLPGVLKLNLRPARKSEETKPHVEQAKQNTALVQKHAGFDGPATSFQFFLSFDSLANLHGYGGVLCDLTPKNSGGKGAKVRERKCEYEPVGTDSIEHQEMISQFTAYPSERHQAIFF